MYLHYCSEKGDQSISMAYNEHNYWELNAIGTYIDQRKNSGDIGRRVKYSMYHKIALNDCNSLCVGCINSQMIWRELENKKVSIAIFRVAFFKELI